MMYMTRLTLFKADPACLAGTKGFVNADGTVADEALTIADFGNGHSAKHNISCHPLFEPPAEMDYSLWYNAEAKAAARRIISAEFSDMSILHEALENACSIGCGCQRILTLADAEHLILAVNAALLAFEQPDHALPVAAYKLLDPVAVFELDAFKDAIAAMEKSACSLDGSDESYSPIFYYRDLQSLKAFLITARLMMVEECSGSSYYIVADKYQA